MINSFHVRLGLDPLFVQGACYDLGLSFQGRVPLSKTEGCVKLFAFAARETQ